MGNFLKNNCLTFDDEEEQVRIYKNKIQIIRVQEQIKNHKVTMKCNLSRNEILFMRRDELYEQIMIRNYKYDISRLRTRDLQHLLISLILEHEIIY
jgi:hypothetical protein